MRFSFVFLALLPVAATADPLFVNRSGDLGITHEYVGAWEYFVGGGVATFDCDGDLLPELFVAGGEEPAKLFRNQSALDGKVSFVENTPEELGLTGVTGAYPLDINSDGYLDLFVMRVGENRIILGGKNCAFHDASEALNLSTAQRWTTAFSATWEGDNIRPTLAIGNYVNRHDPAGPFEACDTNVLLRPQGSKYDASIALEPAFCPLSMLFSDWGRNGRQDLRVSNDRHYYVRDGSEQIWAMEETPRPFDTDDGWQNFSIWGMGIASRDLNGDGLPEIFLTSMGDQKMQVLDATRGGPSFVDATFDRGTTAHRPYLGGDGRPSTGWHVEFGDVDNDGLDDVFIAKGNVDQMMGSAMDDPNNLLMQNSDGNFTEKGDIAGIASLVRSRGGALVDLNLDGRLDLVVVNRRAPMEIYENMTEAGNWLLLDIHQEGINPNAVGAWVEIVGDDSPRYREITVGGGHASGSATLLHFGLGEVSDVKIRVVWPDGVVSGWLGADANQVLHISRDGSKLVGISVR